MDFCEFINAASVLASTGTNIRPIFQTNETLTAAQIQELVKLDAAVQTANP